MRLLTYELLDDAALSGSLVSEFLLGTYICAGMIDYVSLISFSRFVPPESVICAVIWTV